MNDDDSVVTLHSSGSYPAVQMSPLWDVVLDSDV